MKFVLSPLASLVTLLSLTLLGGCSGLRTGSAGGVLVQLEDMATGSGSNQAAVAEFNGQPALLYATKDNRIVFQQGQQRQLLDETAPVSGGNRFQLQRQDDRLHAFWWSHEEAKNLYFTSSADKGISFSPVSIVNDAHGILAPFSLLRGPQGVVGMIYGDEREPRYQAYFNRSTDYGRTWARPDQRLDVAPADKQASDVREPQSVEVGSAWITVWADVVTVAGKPGFRVLSRRSEDAGLSWSAPEILFSSDKLIASLRVKAQGNNVLIAADEHDRGVFILASQDQGRSWRASGALAGTSAGEAVEGASNNGIQMAVAGERAHLVWMQDRKAQKTKIMRASFDIAQGKWLSDAAQMDVKPYDNTRSVSPVVTAASTGLLTAAWVDYRDIKPNIYISTSFDQGNVWSAPQAVLKPGEVSAGWPQLMPWLDRVAIGYEVYPADQIKSGKFVLRLIPSNEATKTLSQFGSWPAFGEAERKAKLEERVKTLWDNRVAGNYQPTYEVFDFAFKAFTPEKDYLNSVGLITYQSFSVNDISISGNEAVVKMKIKYEVKPTPLPSGKILKAAPVEVDAANTWVWVGNNWHLVYSPSFGQPNLSY